MGRWRGESFVGGVYETCDDNATKPVRVVG